MTISTSSLASSLASAPPFICPQGLSEGSLLTQTNKTMFDSFQNAGMPASRQPTKFRPPPRSFPLSPGTLLDPVLIQSFLQSAAPTSAYSVPGSEGPEGPRMNHNSCPQASTIIAHSICQPGSLVTSSRKPSLIALGKLEPC